MSQIKAFLGSQFVVISLLFWCLPWLVGYGVLNILISTTLVMAFQFILIEYYGRWYRYKKQLSRGENSVNNFWKVSWWVVGILLVANQCVGALYFMREYLIDSKVWWAYGVAFAYLFYLAGRSVKENFFAFIHLGSYFIIPAWVLLGLAISKDSASVNFLNVVGWGEFSLLSIFKCSGVLLNSLLVYELIKQSFWKASIKRIGVMGVLVGVGLCLGLSLFVLHKEFAFQGVNTMLLSLNSLRVGELFKRFDILFLYMGIMTTFVLVVAIRSVLRTMELVTDKRRQGMIAFLVFLVIWVMWTLLPNYVTWLGYFELLYVPSGYFMLFYALREVV